MGWGTWAKDLSFGFWFLNLFAVMVAVWYGAGKGTDGLSEYESHREAAISKGEDGDAEGEGPLELVEKKVGGILVLTIIMFATDPLHNVPPVFIGLFAVLLLTFPAFGPLHVSELAKVNLPALILMCSIIAMGETLSSDPAVSGAMQQYFAAFVEGSDTIFSRYFMTVLSTMPLILLSNTSVAAGLAGHLWPMFAPIYGLQPLEAGLASCMAMGAILLPHQNGPILITVSMRFWEARDFLRVAWIVCLITLFVLTPVQIAVWEATGTANFTFPG